MNSNLAFLFPGQGSQSVGMLADLAASFPLVGETFGEASDALGYDLWSLVAGGPEEELNRTEKTQPAMLAAGIAVWRVWLEQGGAVPASVAGHSLGEYTALVAADAIPFVDAVRLVAARGRFMQEAVPEGEGAMAALLGLDDDAVRAVCAENAHGDVLEAVNFNSPGQVVIAGSSAAVDRALAAAKGAGAKRAVKLVVSAPSHCALMKPAAERLAAELAAVEVSKPAIPVVHNADVAVYDDPAAIRDALVRQLHQPVRWVESVRWIAARGAGLMVECGPGKVLAGLNRRIEKKIDTVAVFDPSGIEQALAAVNGG
ncbi:ACP S-malonyltransferase [Endothiovibrio diazotrophicus]